MTQKGGIAVRCGTQNAIDSRYVVSHNANIGVDIFVQSTGDPGTFVTGTGVQCDGTSCARIDRNQIYGVAASTYSGSCSFNVTGRGLMLSNSAALVASNVILGNQVNALTDMTTSGNIAASCFASGSGVQHLAAGALCIDAGASTGAPTRDYDGQVRDAAPDIGPDEYVP